MSNLEEIEAIKQLKYRYFRFLDSKMWEELGECFTEDAVSAYSGGRWSFEGRAAIMEFLSTALSSENIVSMHQGHHPEIKILDSEHAEGIWYLEDYVITVGGSAPELGADTILHGAGFYHDEYVKVDGEWKFKHTGYERTFEEHQDRSKMEGLSVTTRFLGKS
ncbi:MAG: nuclear transport factor 2 family protein [Deltaproteobacteria bacterium]|nr:nuclear transport factor 2 family protein [Deltaproteobacteria bacterium]